MWLSVDRIMRFCSHSSLLISAFINAASLTVIVSQLPGFFGIPTIRASPPNCLLRLIDFFEDIPEIRTLDTLLGCLCVLFILTIKFSGDHLSEKWKDDYTVIEEEAEETEHQSLLRKLKRRPPKRVLKSIMHWITLARNLIIVILCAIVAYALRHSHPFRLTKHLKPGLPSFSPPQFSMNQTETYEGRTLRFVRSFGEIFQDLSPGWILMPFLAALGAVSIPKAISTSTQNPVPRRLLGNKIPVKNFDPSQEILTLGLANLFGAFFKSFPVAISFSRSVIAHTSGVKTQFNNIITGIIVLLALMPVVSPAFHYIPITTLSSVIICAVILIIKPKDVVIAYRTNFVDFLLYLITFILTLTAGLAAGVLVGLILNLIILLTKITRPYVETKFARTPTEEGEQQFGFPYAIIKPSQSIHFPAIDYFSSR
ncbi:sodium-independent sulfate anion transporter-like protein, partial [Dinothrombium tinctorium]